MSFKLKFKMSERQQVLLTIPAAVLALTAIWFLLLRPQFLRKSEIESLRSQIAGSEYAHRTMEELLVIQKHERKLGTLAEAEWKGTLARLSTFENSPGKNVARIDYKRELFDARLRLSRRSEELGVQLIPKDLGLKEALGADDSDVRIRMLQLHTVEKLVDTILCRRVFKLHSISPKEPVLHKNPDKKKLLTEYPVMVDFEMAFDDLYLFFRSIFEEHRLFAIRNIRISSGTVPSAPLRVRAVMSALVFE